jgi:hypothetical protein
MRLADFCPGSGAASFVCEAPAFVEEKGDLYISTAKGLCGARGAMMALGIEGAAALGFYGVWQLWRLFR